MNALIVVVDGEWDNLTILNALTCFYKNYCNNSKILFLFLLTKVALDKSVLINSLNVNVNVIESKQSKEKKNIYYGKANVGFVPLP